MKNVLIYLNPAKEFDEEGKVCIKIQIDNSLDLGWRLEDILLFTNFPYEYNGVKAIELDGSSYSDISTKIVTLSYLFDIGFIKDELYWVHDIDAFQNNIITENEIELANDSIAMTDNGVTSRLACGSIFFKNGSADIFKLIKEKMELDGVYSINEEKSLRRLMVKNVNNINPRIKLLNISYNYQMWDIGSCYPKAIKPIRVVHFHPFRDFKGSNTLNFFLRGKNRLGVILMEDRLIKIFNKHCIV